MKSFVVIFMVFHFCSAAQEHETPAADNGIFGIKKNTLVTYSLLGYTAASLYTEYQWWWKGNYHPFRYENDGFLHNYSLGVDKIGHFYTSYLYFNAVFEVMQWGDFDDRTMLLTAIAMPLSHALSIEIGDGFSTYAFSGVDLAANILGIGYGVLQQQVPFFRNFSVKWSYYPSGIIPLDRAFRLTDDYDGHIYWLSWNIYGTLPERLQQYWIPYLNIAVGYGGKNISGRPAWVGTPISSPGIPERKFAVSLDYHLRAVDLGNGFAATLRNIVDLFHFPAPGVTFDGKSRMTIHPVLLH
jgi:hypothetical protein